MPLNRRMLAADYELAEVLSQIAQKNNTSLYSLTNRLIQAYMIMEKLGYKDPIDAAVDLVFYLNIFNTGFKITPPRLDGEDGWEKLGESLWLVISMENPNIDPRLAIVRLASILIDDKNVYIDRRDETRIMITIPVNSKIGAKELRLFLQGFSKEALKGFDYKIEWRSNVVMLKIREK
jgi:hypothetical protein